MKRHPFQPLVALLGVAVVVLGVLVATFGFEHIGDDALALLGAASVHAESQPGFYVGAGIGQATLEADDVGFDADDTAFKVFGGYSFNDYFAVELTYFDGGAPSEEFDLGIGVPVTL